MFNLEKSKALLKLSKTHEIGNLVGDFERNFNTIVKEKKKEFKNLNLKRIACSKQCGSQSRLSPELWFISP